MTTPATDTPLKTSKPFDKGILYVATGKRCNEEALRSANSVRKHMGNELPVAIFSDQKMSEHPFDAVYSVTDPCLDYKDKIRFLDKTPFQRTLFLDCDTYACGNFTELFELLDVFDFAAAHEPGRISLKQKANAKDCRVNLLHIPPCFSEFNSGVLLYKKAPEVFRVFSQWLSIYDATRSECEHDQPALSAAVYHSNLKFYVLPPEYNVKFHTCCFVSGEAKILHGRFSDITAVRANPETTFNILERCINENKGCRCLFPHLGIIMGKGEYGFPLNSKIDVKKTAFDDHSV